MNANGQADIGYWQMIEMQKDPVAWMDKRTNKCVVFINTPPSDDWIPLYTHPHPDNLGLAESIIKQKEIEIRGLTELLRQAQENG